MTFEFGEALMVGRFMQCCGVDQEWDCPDLCTPDEDCLERCPRPATCLYDNGIECIPLCAEHYDAWCRPDAETGDGTNPIWYSQAWLERYEGA